MKIIKIDGGMGNQMFQYAFACKLKKLYPTQDVLLDISNFKGQIDRSYELKRVFDVKMPVAPPFQKCRFTFPFSTNTKWGGRMHSRLGKYFNRDIYAEKRPNYFSFSEEPLKIAGSCYYTGVYFNEGYFADISDEIRSVFTFKQPLVGSFKKIREEIEVTC